jgi:hypothetical protein
MGRRDELRELYIPVSSAVKEHAAVGLAVQIMREEKPLQLRHKRRLSQQLFFCSPRTPLQSIPFGRQNEYLTVSSDCSFFDH